MLVGETTANSPWQVTVSELADGERLLTATATDRAGNVSDLSAELEITVDTISPELTVTSPVAGAQLTLGAKLTVTSDGTGSVIVEWSYQFDDLTPIPLSVNPLGEFDEELDPLSARQNVLLTKLRVSAILAGAQALRAAQVAN